MAAADDPRHGNAGRSRARCRRSGRRQDRSGATSSSVVIAAVIILTAAPFLVMAAEGIATESGLGETFVGASFLALATSLPELATALAAVRIGAYDLAVGALLGSNAFNMAIIFVADLAYTSGPILSAVDPPRPSWAWLPSSSWPS